MNQPYTHLRAQMSLEAQRQAAEKFTALRVQESADTRAAQRAFRVWYLWSFPYTGQADALTAWQALPAIDRTCWEYVAQAARKDDE